MTDPHGKTCKTLASVNRNDSPYSPLGRQAGKDLYVSSQQTAAVLGVVVAEENAGRCFQSHLDKEPDSLGQKFVSTWTRAFPHSTPAVLLNTVHTPINSELFNICFPLPSHITVALISN